MSFSEIETVSKRASKAMGYSWGISEEIGKSIRILEMFNLPGISTLNQYFKKIKNNHPKKLKNILKINDNIIEEFGAVSKQTAYHMASSLVNNFSADIGIGITGIAGPNGGSKNKPVGLVWIGFGTKNKITAKKFLFNGNRLDIRLKATLESLKELNNFLKNYP